MLLRGFWKSRGALNLFLLPLAWAFGACVAARTFAYRLGLARSRQMPVPVVVVGGITAGGGGKTPFTIALARQLAQAGRHPGVVLRGYRGSIKHPLLVEPDTDPAACGDEAILIRRETNVPVCVAASRPEAAVRLLAHHLKTDIIISDDGLQHLALKRDLEIVVVDPEYGLGNGWMLPAGPLREPQGRLSRVDLVVGWGESPIAIRTIGSQLLRLNGAGTEVSPEGLSGTVAAVAGIANPERFFSELEGTGITLSSRHAFPDHHAFIRRDLERIRADHIIMTSKDAVKCLGFADRRCLRLKVTQAIDEKTIERIASL